MYCDYYWRRAVESDRHFTANPAGDLARLEQELGVPIVVMAWAASREAADISRDYMVERHCPGMEHAADSGITIWVGGYPNYDSRPRSDIRHLTIFEREVVSVIPATTDDVDAAISVDGIVVGEIMPLKVWLYPQMYDEVQPDELLDAILKACRAAVNDDFIAEQLRCEQETSRDRLSEYVRNTYQLNITTYRDEIDSLTTALDSYRSRIATTIQSLRQKQEMLDALLLVQNNDTGETMLTEWDQLIAHPRCDSAAVRGNAIVIRTSDDLRMTRPDTGESRWLGRFEININIEDFTVKLRNLNTRRGGRDHPHVNNGSPCFGGHHDSFYELLGRGQLYVAFDLLIQYLENINLKDAWGAYGSYWFDVPDERPLDEPTTATAA